MSAARSTVRPLTDEEFVARFGADTLAYAEAELAAAPPPSPELIAKLRRLFAAVPDRVHA